MSHKFLVMMVGSSHPTVTITAGALQHAGIIRYRYARVTVIDRTALEAASCECYAPIKKRFEELDL